MTKPSEIFDTPEATGFVKALMNEKLVVDFLINEGWVKQIGNLAIVDILREEIVKLLNAKDQEKEEAIAKARDQEAKLWFETWYSHYISPTKPLQGEFARFATERIQMTGYERDQALPTEDNK